MNVNINNGIEVFVDYLNNVMDKPDGYSYEYTTRGSKYYKVIMNSRGSRSVYAFVNKSNGDILKPAGWKSPAKSARGSVLIPESYKHADWAGGWLYKIFGNIY